MRYLPFLLAIAFLCSCESRGSLPGESAQTAGFHVGAILNSSGAYLMLAGISAIALGLLAFGASFLTAFIPQGLRHLFLFIAECGVGALLIGAGLVWLGEHPWIIAIIYGLVGLALLVRGRMYIARWLHLPTPSIAVPTPLSDYQKQQIQKTQA